MSAANNFTTLDEIRQEAFAKSPELKRIWEESAPRRAISLMFAQMRIVNGLSNQDIDSRANWNKGTARDLQGALGKLPDLQTIADFAEACGMTIRLVASHKKGNEVAECALEPTPTARPQAVIPAP